MSANLSGYRLVRRTVCMPALSGRGTGRPGQKVFECVNADGDAVRLWIEGLVVPDSVLDP
ncbi:hypothetical protein EYF80_032060 [Liparis tanakae]|uniref:Uncharacterized protein n=1 Tax=Liparis tanakae TaxID=230148 RepID=A0A4Z2GWN0_9TELE|nr:hypothetical protein EYF80_032060 [Liparis tanakae]